MLKEAAGKSAQTSPRDGCASSQKSYKVKTTEAAYLQNRTLENVLARTRSRDKCALRELFTMTSHEVFGECLHVCRNRMGAETVLVEIYVMIWRNEIVWCHSSEGIVTTLLRIATERAEIWRRDTDLSRTQSDGQRSCGGAVGSATAKANRYYTSSKSNLEQILAKFDPPQRDAIRSAFLDKVTYAELAESYRVDTETMKRWVRLGIAEVTSNWDRSEAGAVNDHCPE